MHNDDIVIIQALSQCKDSVPEGFGARTPALCDPSNLIDPVVADNRYDSVLILRLADDLDRVYFRRILERFQRIGEYGLFKYLDELLGHISAESLPLPGGKYGCNIHFILLSSDLNCRKRTAPIAFFGAFRRQ